MTNNKDNKRGFAERKTRYWSCMNIQMEQSLKARWPFQRIDGLLQRLKKICYGPFAIKMAERAKTHQWKQTTCSIKRHVNFRPRHLTKTSSLTVETSWSVQLIARMWTVREMMERSFKHLNFPLAVYSRSRRELEGWKWYSWQDYFVYVQLCLLHNVIRMHFPEFWFIW